MGVWFKFSDARADSFCATTSEFLLGGTGDMLCGARPARPGGVVQILVEQVWGPHPNSVKKKSDASDTVYIQRIVEI